jgi:hypothetical protein
MGRRKGVSHPLADGHPLAKQYIVGRIRDEAAMAQVR